MRKQLFIGLLVSALCLYFAVRGLSIREIVQALQEANAGSIGLAMLIYSTAHALRAVRWEILMRPVKETRAFSLFGPMMIGFFSNNVLPLRVGELIRAHLCSRKIGITMSASVGTVVLERLCDGLTFLGIFLSIAFFFPFPEKIRTAAYTMGVTSLVGMMVLWAAVTYQDATGKLLARLPLSQKIQDRLAGVHRQFSKGLSGMKTPAFFLKAFPLSVIIWLIEGWTLYFIIRAFPVSASFLQALFVLFFLGLSIALPQAPGYVGTVELFGTTALGLLGVAKEQALPIILAVHGTQFAYIFLLGLICLWSEGLSFKSLIKQRIDTPAH